MLHIVTDTDANLPQDIANEFHIPVVPQYVIFGEESLRDYVDITPAEFYARQALSPITPRTSAPNVGDFARVFGDILKEDPEATILGIHPSREMSMTVQAARTAAEYLMEQYPRATIRVFDTRSMSVGQALMVWEAARMARDGGDLEAITARLAFMRDHHRAYFVVDTLEYLAKGGRIGRAAHLIGLLLDIKPTLTLADGVVESYARTRTRRRSLELIRRIVIEEAGQGPGLRLAVAHAICEEEARQLADDLCAALNPDYMMFSEVGPAVGAHAGPRAMGVCFVRVPE